MILYVEQGSSDKMLTRYQELLTLISHVTSNESLEAINRCSCFLVFVHFCLLDTAGG